MATHNEIGMKGEVLALQYLERKGYTIKEINWRWGHYEIDIIAQLGNVLVIVEVKTRSNAYFGFPERSVHDAKKAFLARAASEYKELHSLEMDTRFDIVAIVMKDKGDYQIEHFEDAFFPYDF